MISRDDLKRANPTVTSATIRFVRGEITEPQYERLVVEERKRDTRPPGEQTNSSKR
jgi:uncharacterized membrane protein